MNKRKVAVFVEGQTELVFVREFLSKWYCYDANVIGFDCYTLLKSEFQDVAYTYGSVDSENYYMLVNVGNDCSVLSKIRERIQQLDGLGYQLVIGLRDMYSAQYIKDANGRKINYSVTQLHINTVREQIELIPEGDMIDFHFAIMEVEAWLLGMSRFLQSIGPQLTHEYVLQHTNINLSEDPETSLFHPAAELGKIYGLVGRTYDKHEADIASIMDNLQVDDFINLIQSGNCQTFNAFAESLLAKDLENMENSVQRLNVESRICSD